MTSFEHNGVVITLKTPTMRTRLVLSDLRTMAGYWDMEKSRDRDDTEVALNLLYLVESVQGDLGFVVPMNGNTTPETVKTFIDALLNYPGEELYLKWNSAVWDTRRTVTNDPDLLPPSELTEDQKKTRKPKKKDVNKE